jgi:hypothetical protein
MAREPADLSNIQGWIEDAETSLSRAFDALDNLDVDDDSYEYKLNTAYVDGLLKDLGIFTGPTPESIIRALEEAARVRG